MTPRLATVSAAKVLEILRARGSEVARQSGSHLVEAKRQRAALGPNGENRPDRGGGERVEGR